MRIVKRRSFVRSPRGKDVGDTALVQSSDAVRAAFTDPNEFWSSRLYRHLSGVVAGDRYLVGLAAHTRDGQVPTFAFFGASVLPTRPERGSPRSAPAPSFSPPPACLTGAARPPTGCTPTDWPAATPT